MFDSYFFVIRFRSRLSAQQRMVFEKHPFLTYLTFTYYIRHSLSTFFVKLRSLAIEGMWREQI